MQPLAEILRPSKLSDFIGQEHLVGENGIITKLLAIDSTRLPSLIMWGPSGVGKTTLARIIAKKLNRKFYEFSAVNTKVKDIEGVISEKPIIFLDEIHRFNKAQQDKLLPHVENGNIILIGATTENPSFEVISPLLSRCRVLILNQLNEDNLNEIVGKVTKHLKIKVDKKGQEFLINSSNGDARILINTLELASQINVSKLLKTKDIEEAMQKRALVFDKNGDNFYDTISAFIKSMRASNVDAALYYLARMISAGQDPLYIARRMVIFASEDIGMAQPTALVVANEVFRSCEIIGLPECRINLAHGVVYLASAKKNRSSYDALNLAMSDVEVFGNLPIPLNLRNPVTKLMKNAGYGKGYEMYNKETLLPSRLKDKKYYKE
ncbi:MAG: replication-associated recombination protein A [Microgenomates group bacterium]